MTRSNFEKVGDFHKKFGLPVADDIAPTILDDKVFLFRYQFLLEEMHELLAGHRAKSVVDVADAIADLIYVAYGTAHMCGIPLDRVFTEVQRANMQKERAAGDKDTRSKRDSSLDVIKPEGWQPPNIKGVLHMHKKKAHHAK